MACDGPALGLSISLASTARFAWRGWLRSSTASPRAMASAGWRRGFTRVEQQLRRPPPEIRFRPLPDPLALTFLTPAPFGKPIARTALPLQQIEQL